jgi:predicted transposase YdaD
LLVAIEWIDNICSAAIDETLNTSTRLTFYASRYDLFPIYEWMVSEISIFTYRHRNFFSDWRAVAIYPSQNMEQSSKEIVVEMLASGRITPIYLDELENAVELPTGLDLMVLTTLESEAAIEKARYLIQRSLTQQDQRIIIDLVSVIMVYKFSNLSRDKVDAMLGIELQQTRVYQDARAEGESIGEVRGLERGLRQEKALVLRQLTRKLENLSPDVVIQVNSLLVEKIESLGEALLDFTEMGDLMAWLDSNK